MSSTRNLNTMSNYEVEKNQNSMMEEYQLYNGFGVHERPALLVRGTNPAMHRDQLSSNSVDVESMLRGIRSTNMEGPSFKVDPRLNSLNELSYFNPVPLIVPPSFQHSTTERPNYLG